MIDELGLRDSNTDKYIVDRLRDSLQILKQTKSEQQRQEYRIVLPAVAPEKVTERVQGMGRAYEDRLHVSASLYSPFPLQPLLAEYTYNCVLLSMMSLLIGIVSRPSAMGYPSKTRSINDWKSTRQQS